VVAIVYLLMILAFWFMLISFFSDTRGEKVSVLKEFEIIRRLKPRNPMANILEKAGLINIFFLKALRIDKYYINLVDRSGINLSYISDFLP